MSPAQIARRAALLGVVLVAIVAPRTASVPALILMLAAGVAVPLGLAVANAPRWLALASPIGVAGGVIGWAFPPGAPLAITGAAMHALVCAGAGLVAATRVLPMLRRRAFDPLPDVALVVGLLFLPAAAVWLLASRAAQPLAGFQEPVVTFTAAHFHFAGFTAPTILGGVGRMLTRAHERVTPLVRIATVAVCAGVPLTAIGIATNHVIEQCAAVLVASGMLCAAVVLVRQASRRPRLAGVLFVVSGATLFLTMTLAATFALTSSAGRGSSLHGAVELQTMIDFHGAANAIGFALAALVALNLVTSPEKSSETTRPPLRS